MKIKLRSYNKYTKNCITKGTEEYKVYQRMVNQRKTDGIGGQPPLFVGKIDHIKRICKEFKYRYIKYNPKCLAADDPGLMTFGFLMYFEDGDGKEHACLLNIPLSIIRHEMHRYNGDLELFRDDILSMF